MNNKTKALLIVGGLAACGVATYFIIKAVKRKKEAENKQVSKPVLAGNNITEETFKEKYGVDKYGWPVISGRSGNRPTANNNPMNIRTSVVKWQGQIGTDAAENGFCVFDTLHHGLRASFKNLRTYEKSYNRKTLREKLVKWAPPKENRKTYPDEVAQMAGVGCDEAAPIGNVEYWVKVIPYWAKLEGYSKTITADQIRAAYRDANI